MPDALRFWVDAQLPPGLALWLTQEVGAQAHHVEAVGLRAAKDRTIFDAARTVGVVVITKDLDFVHLLERYGPPPQIVWITCGNVTNSQLREIVRTAWSRTVGLLASGEPLVEISGPR